MKQAIKIIAGLGAIASLMFLAMRYAPDQASVSFVGFRQNSHGDRVAVFRAKNPSPQPVSFFGFSSSEPMFSYRIPSAGAWDTRLGYSCGMGASLQVLPSLSAMDFEVNFAGFSDEFAVGICFWNGDPAKVSASYSDNIFNRIFWYLRSWIPEPMAWSEVVRDQGQPLLPAENLVTEIQPASS